MSDLNTNEQEEQASDERVEQPNFNPFADEQPEPAEQPIIEEKIEETKIEEKREEEKVIEQPIVESELKTNLGYESWDAAKAALEELKTKAATPAEIKYANEESEKLHKALVGGDRKQVLAILKKQEQLEELSSAEVSVMNAGEIVKTAMQFKYADLTKEEIDYKFNKQFSIPARPIQGELEDEAEYQEKLSNWEARKKDAEMDLMIEAKQSRPELEKLKAELVIPDIQKQESSSALKQPTQEDLEAEIRVKDSFLKTVEASVKDFSGFNVAVKDKDVYIPLSYVPSQEEKDFVQNQLKEFAEKGFNANAIFAQRWVNDDGTVKTAQMVKDLTLLLSEGKMSQKFANDAANKRLELYVKGRKNINVNETNQSGVAELNKDGKSEMEDVQNFFWNN